MSQVIKNWKMYWSVYLVVGIGFLATIFVLALLDNLINSI